MKTMLSIFVMCLALAMPLTAVYADQPGIEVERGDNNDERIAEGPQLMGNDAILEMEDHGFTVEGDKIYDQNGDEIIANSSGESSVENSSAMSPEGEHLDMQLGLDNELDQSATCNYWWVHGRHTWKYNEYIIYTYAKFWATTYTTYGTATKTCGTPLICDRLYYKAKVGDSSWTNFSWDQTGNNTSRIEKTVKAHGVNIGSPCGMRVYHEALKNGIKWHTNSKSGCYK